jgi:hypothetical protein
MNQGPIYGGTSPIARTHIYLKFKGEVWVAPFIITPNNSLTKFLFPVTELWALLLWRFGFQGRKISPEKKKSKYNSIELQIENPLGLFCVPCTTGSTDRKRDYSTNSWWSIPRGNMAPGMIVWSPRNSLGHPTPRPCSIVKIDGNQSNQKYTESLRIQTYREWRFGSPPNLVSKSADGVTSWWGWQNTKVIHIHIFWPD